MENVVPLPQVKTGEAVIEKPVGIETLMEFLGCKRNFIYSLIQKKIIPSHKIGGLRMFYLSEVDEAIRKM